MSTANVENCRPGRDVKLNEPFLILKAIFISWPLGARLHGEPPQRWGSAAVELFR